MTRPPPPQDNAELSEHASVLIEAGRIEEAIKALQASLLLNQPPANDVNSLTSRLGERMGAKLWEPYVAPEELIKGVIARGKVGQIAGFGGSAKTWVAISACIAISLGVPWLDRFPTVQGKTLYLDWENGSDELRRRCQKILIGMGLSLDSVPNFDAVAMPPIYMDDPEFEAVIAVAVQDVALCVIDTLKAASPNVEENSSAIRLGIDKLKRVAERTGCSFFLVIHSKKTGGDKGETDIRESGRGSSAIYDAADCAMHIQHRFDEPALVRSSKARNGRAFDPFTLELKDTPEGGTRLVTENAPTERDARKAYVADREQVIIRTLKETPGASFTAILDALKSAGVGVRPGKLPQLLNTLAMNGAIKNRGTDRNQEWEYVL